MTSGSGTSYAYTYDADGNMLTKTAGSAITTYAYNTADELCWAYAGASANPCSSAPTGATTYSFDSDGNETGSSAGASFSYNAKNQATSITYGDSSLPDLTYTGPAQDDRISAGATTFDNSGVGNAISTTAGSSTYYLYDDEGIALGERIGSAHYYFLTNAVGSVVAVINGSGQTVADRYGYGPYGNTTYESGTVANPFGYAGGYTDPTGLILFGARYYDPNTDRWTQVDPIASGQASAYAYGDDDPVNNSDPSGCWSHEVTAKAEVTDIVLLPLNTIWLTVEWNGNGGAVTGATGYLTVNAHNSAAVGNWSITSESLWWSSGCVGCGSITLSAVVSFKYDGGVFSIFGNIANRLSLSVTVYGDGYWAWSGAISIENNVGFRWQFGAWVGGP